MSWNTHIYVAVLGGRADVWRPVLAERVGETTYAILEQPYDPDSERWSFEPGDAVECELIQAGGRKILAATRKADGMDV